MFNYDIVTVLDDGRLIDGESYERRYRTREGCGLKPGFYVVVWDEQVGTPAFDERAVYCGPHENADTARVTLAGYLDSSSRPGNCRLERATAAVCA